MLWCSCRQEAEHFLSEGPQTPKPSVDWFLSCLYANNLKNTRWQLPCNKKPLRIFLPYREWAWPQYWWYLIAAQEVERVVHSLEGCWFDYPPPSAACWSISEQDTETKNCECDKCFKAVWAVSKPVQRCRSVSSFTLTELMYLSGSMDCYTLIIKHFFHWTSWLNEALIFIF